MAIPTFAFNPVDGVKNTATFPDPASETAARKQIQDVFDQIATYINDEITDVLNSTTDGASGGDSVAMTAISGVTGATVQAIAEDLKTQIDATVIDQIPDGSLTDDKLDTDIKIGSLATLTTTEQGNVVGAINEVDANVDDLAGVGRTT